MNDAVKAATRQLLGALLDSGHRAAASALKSAFKDGKKVVREVDRRIGKALDQLEVMASSDDEDEKRDDEDNGIRVTKEPRKPSRGR